MSKVYETDGEVLENLRELHTRFLKTTRKFHTSDRDNMREMNINSWSYYRFIKDPFARRWHKATLQKIVNFVMKRERQINALEEVSSQIEKESAQ